MTTLKCKQRTVVVVVAWGVCGGRITGLTGIIRTINRKELRIGVKSGMAVLLITSLRCRLSFPPLIFLSSLAGHSGGWDVVGREFRSSSGQVTQFPTPEIIFSISVDNPNI